MAVKNVVQAIPLTNIASTSVTSSYQAINPTGLPNACFMLKIINNSSEDVTVSYNGTTDNDYVPANTVGLLPVQTNAQPNNFIANFPLGLQIYVKGTAGMSGNVYLSGYYQPSGG